MHGRSHSYKQENERGRELYSAQGIYNIPPPLPPKGVGRAKPGPPTNPQYSKQPPGPVVSAPYSLQPATSTQYSQQSQWDPFSESRGTGGSQSDYRQEGYVQECPMPQETASEHSLSDSTQTSERSEPTHRRPR